MSQSIAAAIGSVPVVPAKPARPLLLDVLRERARDQGHAEPTIVSFVHWVTSFVQFHGRRHPRELHVPDVARFLEHVGRTAREALIAIEAARTALEFLYQDVLKLDLGELPRPRP